MNRLLQGKSSNFPRAAALLDTTTGGLSQSAAARNTHLLRVHNSRSDSRGRPRWCRIARPWFRRAKREWRAARRKGFRPGPGRVRRSTTILIANARAAARPRSNTDRYVIATEGPCHNHVVAALHRQMPGAESQLKCVLCFHVVDLSLGVLAFRIWELDRSKRRERSVPFPFVFFVIFCSKCPFIVPLPSVRTALSSLMR